MTAPTNNLAAKSIPEEDHHARLSSATLLAARMMLPSEDGRSAVSASERPSRTCSPGTIPRSNAFPGPSTKGTTFYTAAEQASIPKDPPSVPVNGEANNVNCFDSNGEPEAASAIAIDGRDEYEEMHWYDPAVRAQHARPGRGVLPPLLADMFHTSNHALYLVSTENHPPMVSPSLPHTPTADEVHDAIPHPNASFCPEHNGWVLLQWSASAVLPPLAREPKTPLPNQNRRERTRSCVSDDGQRFGQANLTHHWHRYEKVVDAAQLNPPYTHGELLLDLYLCCQCSMTCLFSDVIPGVIPRSLVEEFTLDKVGHLAVDKATAVVAWETVLTIIDNRLWRDEKRSLPVARPKFREKIGWNSRAERVFEVLGFRLEDALKGDGKVQEQMLRPPPIDPATAEGRASRAKLLRAWVELSAWLAIYEKANKEALKHHTPLALRVQAHSERELCEMGIGAHMISQTSRGVLPEHDISEMQLEPSWEALGMTPRMHSWELLEFAYLAQCRCDPANTMVYFTHLLAIVDGMADVGVSVPDRLWSFIENEKQERRRFTMEEHAGYARILGFGRDNHLGVELDSDVEDDFVAQAWRRARRRTWLTAGDQAEKRAQLDDALRAVAQQRSSIALVKIWNEESGSGMSRDTAYQMLGVPRDADETMLLTAYSSRIEDRPDQSERMREALDVIAEVTNSERLRQFLATGHDPVTMNAGPDMSRGTREQYYSHSLSRSGSPSSTATESSGQLAGKELPVEDVRPLATTTTSSSKVLSYHCRSCLRDPCTNPVATVCGHIFCHSCIVRSLATRGCCPVCQKSFLIRLHVEVEVDRF
ncbi:hypothetical protein LXA43DRAFT_389666 [Ganoderma leucocontextum]|nr:hypothetical protein LXA43DRAFT_389666 [Ganoderma leucocontextum]